MKYVLACFAFAVAACAGQAPPSGPDAGVKTNQPFGATCSVVSDSSSECTSGICTNTFDMSPMPLCSQKCTVLGGTDPTCPMGSMGQKCNKKGYCKP
jgi:hypothetical protein